MFEAGYDHFTSSGQRALTLAGEAARNLGHKCIGTEHLLLGLLEEHRGAAVRALEALNVAPDRVRERVIRTVGYGVDKKDYGRPLTPRAREALELALEEALRTTRNYAAGEHILLGLLRESKGVAARVLGELGANLDGVRREVERIVDGKEKIAEGAHRTARLSPATGFRARIKGLVIRACCGLTDEERAVPQPLRVDLGYLYEAGEGDDLFQTVDYGAIVESVADLMENEEFKLLETGARMVGEYVLGEFPSVREVTITVTKLNVPVAREVSGVSVEATFGW
jgi:dihydroneopterin aldolase